MECIPNFSEGRDSWVIDAIADAIRQSPGIRLLSVDVSAAANRSVFTFAGPPSNVVDAVLAAASIAFERIDMRAHHGVHPRLGALDVCPLVPLRDMSVTQADAHAHLLAARLGERFGLPVYLYEHSARKVRRRHLATIRQGQYEGLTARLRDPAWRPDYGPSRFDARLGATAVGVRDLMIAYNICIDGTRRAARRIAERIREIGRISRSVRIPGMFKGLRALGWYLDGVGAQVSMNITRIAEAPLHSVFETVSEQARSFDARVTGSELIGMIPRAPLWRAGAHFLGEDGAAMSKLELMNHAARRLNLRAVKPFEVESHVLEEALGLAEDL